MVVHCKSPTLKCGCLNVSMGVWPNLCEKRAFCYKIRTMISVLVSVLAKIWSLPSFGCHLPPPNMLATALHHLLSESGHLPWQHMLQPAAMRMSNQNYGSPTAPTRLSIHTRFKPNWHWQHFRQICSNMSNTQPFCFCVFQNILQLLKIAQIVQYSIRYKIQFYEQLDNMYNL